MHSGRGDRGRPFPFPDRRLRRAAHVPDLTLFMLRTPPSSIGLALHIGLFSAVAALAAKVVTACSSRGPGNARVVARVTLEDGGGSVLEAYDLGVYADGAAVDVGCGGTPQRYEELVVTCNALQSLCLTFRPVQGAVQPRLSLYHMSSNDTDHDASCAGDTLPELPHLSRVFHRTFAVTSWRLVASASVSSL